MTENRGRVMRRAELATWGLAPAGVLLALGVLGLGSCGGRSILGYKVAPLDGAADAPATDAPMAGDARGDRAQNDSRDPTGCAAGCRQPPPPVCLDANHARHFNLPGTCSNGACTFVISDVMCAKGCEAGFCREDPCLGVKCDVPPSLCQSAGTCVAGACRFAATAAGTACDDGDQCTAGDRCDGTGECQGTIVACVAPPPVTCLSPTRARVSDPFGVCGAGACAYAAREVDCLGGCASGQCLGDPCLGIKCDQPPSACFAASGQCIKGACQYTPLPDGTSCADGNACTAVDTCRSGVCQGRGAVSCDDGDQCTADSCDPGGGCLHQPQVDGFACDDGNRCTTIDVCRAGSCHGEALTCDDDNTCTVDACDLKTGACQHLPIPDGSTCSDQNVCTSGDVCQLGQCRGTPVSCADQNECTNDTCDPVAGCRSAPVADGTSCNDESPCTKNDRCIGGVCKGEGLSCDDGNPCTKDNCNPAQNACEHHPIGEGVKCDDGSACTAGDTCRGGSCGGVPVSCDDANPCTAESCDARTGCKSVRVGDGTACDDGDPCTSASQCLAGICVGTAGLSCDDGDMCTIDRCDIGAGTCSHPAAPEGTSCGPPGACTQTLCTSGKCTMTTAMTCDDGNPCTADSCTAAGCAHAPVADGTTCDDKDACTQADQCVGGRCLAMTRLCDDGDPCTADTCAADGACLHTPIAEGGACDDKDACTVGERCQSGVCSGGTPRGCGDGNSCTADLCDPTAGCRHVSAADGTACNDGNACTEADRCRAGVCTGSAVTCTGNDRCTVGRCDPVAGCMLQTAPDGAACNDGDKCTTGDSCQAGKCTGIAKACDDNNPCTVDSCAPLNGGCVNQPAPPNTPCDDGNPCTTDDACNAGTCLGKPGVDRTMCQVGPATGCCLTGICCTLPGCCP
jgi:hypothetical protein